MPPLHQLARALVVGCLAYLLIALGQALVLELWLAGRVEPGASLPTLLYGTLGTLASGCLGGVIAVRLAGPVPAWASGIVLLALAGDTVYVLTRASAGHPWWWNLGGALILLGATGAGAWLARPLAVDPPRAGAQSDARASSPRSPALTRMGPRSAP